MVKPFPLPPRRYRPRGVDIQYEDRDILVVNKASGLLTMSFHKDEDQTAACILTQYVRKGNSRSRNRVFVVHRLDREASGLLVFAKTEEMQQRLKADWAKNDKLYLVAIHGRLKEPRGVIESHLAEDEDQYMASVKDPEKGRLARTAYAVIRATDVLSLLKVRLLTGRKNQIRVHFAELDHAVVNDPKYGTIPSGGRMALHAKELAFNHPYSGERMAFNTGIPDIFTQLAHGLDEQEWAAAGKLDDFI